MVQRFNEIMLYMPDPVQEQRRGKGISAKVWWILTNVVVSVYITAQPWMGMIDKPPQDLPYSLNANL